MTASTPTLREMAMVLFRQRRVFASVSSLVVAITVLYALFGTTYRANMKIMVRPGRADAPVSAEQNAPLDLTRIGVTEEELNSEVELLRGEEVLRKVVEETGIGGRDWFHIFRLNEGRDQRIERLARRVARRLSVEPVKKTNLIAIRYSADDPQIAAKVLRSLSSIYLEKHVTVHRPDGESHFFEQQTSESRTRLEQAQRQLLQFTAAHKIVSAAQERDLALQRLSEMDAGARQTRIELAETKQRVVELEHQIADLPERTTTQVRTADNPELLKSLKSSLLELQLKRTELQTKFEPSHRLVQEVDAQISQAERAIAGEQLAPVRDETTDKNTQYEWAKSELERARVQLMALSAREVTTTAQEANYRALTAKLGQDAVTQDDLLNTEKAAEESYLLYVKKHEEARMDDALDQRGIVNVAIAEQPVVPALPVHSALTVLAFGIVAAGAAGTGAAFTADYFHPAFRDPEDVLAYLEAPVLASLPKGLRGRLSA